MTIKGGEPYASWQIKSQAKAAGLVTKTSWVFNALRFYGYEHRRTMGFKDGKSVGGNEEVPKDSRTYVFVKAEEDKADERPAKKRRKKIVN